MSEPAMTASAEGDGATTMSNDPTAMKRGHTEDAIVSGRGRRAEGTGRRSVAAGGGLRNLHLIKGAALLFLFPSVLVAFGLNIAAASVVLLGCALVIFVIARTSARDDDALLAAPIDFRVLSGCAALAAVLCLLGGEAHVFYTNADWLIRDGVLFDLVDRGFPVFYRYEDQDYLLRAPLGLYMAPALIGRILGLHAAHVAMLVQNAIALTIILYFLAQLANARKLAVVLLFVAFSGLDIVAIMAVEVHEVARSGNFFPISHIEWWNRFVQYSSHVTQLFWAPNHALPGWWFATLVLLHVRREIDISLLVLSFATLTFWSPLAMLGAIPFLAVFALGLLPRGIFAPRIVLAAGAALCFLPIVLYLTVDAGAVPHRFLLGVEGFLAIYVAFLALEIPHAAIIAATWSKIETVDRRILVLAIALLVAIPLYELGPANDFVTRASIIPLFLLAFAFARVATQVPRDNGRLATCISVIVIVSGATPLLEIRRAFAPAYKISDCNFPTSWKNADPTTWPSNYWARVEAVPAWLVPIGTGRVTIENRKCWPDHPTLWSPPE